MPSRLSFAQGPNTVIFTVDYCACGRPFRARTRLLVFNASMPPAILRLRCHGRGICDFSGRPHLQPDGPSHTHGFLTKLKNCYPNKLCNILSKGLFEAYMYKRQSRLWNLMR